MPARTYVYHRGKTTKIMRVVFPLIFAAFSVGAWWDGDPFTAWWAGLLFAVSLILTSMNFVTVVEADRQEVRRVVTGLWGMSGGERVFRFDVFTAVELRRAEGSLTISLCRGWKRFVLCHGGEPLAAESKKLATLLGAPWVDRT